MNYNTLWPGSKSPQIVHAIIEVSAFSTPVKYEMDKHTNLLHVDRFLATSMHYPCNYGYIPGTLSDDGDPVDLLVVTPFPLIPSSVIEVRTLGMLEMTDDKGQDRKILAVPAEGLIDIYDNVKDFSDLPESLLKKIEHFFIHYKDLEPGKWSKVDSWMGLEPAWQEIVNSTKNFLSEIA